MNGYTDKEILGDGLSAEKATTSLMNMFANECLHPEIRDTFMNILKQEHDIQFDVFNMMHQRGLYQTPAAEEQKVQEAKQKFAQCCK